VLKEFLADPAVRFVGVADVQRRRRLEVEMLVKESGHAKECLMLSHMEDILSRDDVDAVLIATGDRWHTPASILAARAGKDIYCEKPCGLTLKDCQDLDDEIRRHQRVFQAGTQRRSIPNYRFAVELARSGKLGKLPNTRSGKQPRDKSPIAKAKIVVERIKKDLRCQNLTFTPNGIQRLRFTVMGK